MAVGLAWLDQQGPCGAPGKRAATPAVTMGDVGTWLTGQEKHALVELLGRRHSSGHGQAGEPGARPSW